MEARQGRNRKAGSVHDSPAALARDAQLSHLLEEAGGKSETTPMAEITYLNLATKTETPLDFGELSERIIGSTIAGIIAADSYINLRLSDGSILRVDMSTTDQIDAAMARARVVILDDENPKPEPEPVKQTVRQIKVRLSASGGWRSQIPSRVSMERSS